MTETAWRKNIPYYLAAAGLFIVLKFWYAGAGNDQLLFLVAPTNWLAGIFTGSSSYRVEGSGYFHPSLNILVDKSCSGFNFWMLSFLMLSFLALKFFDRHQRKALALVVTIASSYILTILVNACRIAVSVVVKAGAGRIFSGNDALAHEAAGIVTYLSFLILIYLLAEKILTRHAQPAAT